MKNQILSTDYFTVQLASQLSDLDRQMVVELYQPLIGQNGVALFLTLWSYHDLNMFTQPHAHDFLFAIMQSDGNLFNRARRSLEAVGLLRTLVEKTDNIDFYTYILYAPKSPDEFLKDIVLSGLFKKYLGEKTAQKFLLFYQKKLIPEKAVDVSASFGEVFHEDYELLAVAKDQDTLLGRVHSSTNKAFDQGVFFTELRLNTLINPKFLKDDEIEKITQYAVLYGLDELTMALILMESITPNKHKIDFEVVRKKAQTESKYPFLNKPTRGKSDLTSQSNLAKKVQMMDSLDPKNFLRLRQGNKPVAPVDLNLIERLATQLHLPFPAINAIIDYTLTTKNNILSSKYVEKVAASVLREGVTSALETMEYLKKIHRGGRSKKNETEIKIDENSQITPKNEDKAVEELAKLLETFEKNKRKKDNE